MDGDLNLGFTLFKSTNKRVGPTCQSKHYIVNVYIYINRERERACVCIITIIAMIILVFFLLPFLLLLLLLLSRICHRLEL